MFIELLCFSALYANIAPLTAPFYSKADVLSTSNKYTKYNSYPFSTDSPSLYISAASPVQMTIAAIAPVNFFSYYSALEVSH